MGKTINPEYLRKTAVAAMYADAAWLRGGLDGMHAELAQLRRLDSDPVIIAELERLYHNQCRRVLPEQRLAPTPLEAKQLVADSIYRPTWAAFYGCSLRSLDVTCPATNTPGNVHSAVALLGWRWHAAA